MRGKRIFAFVLVIFMAVALFPVSALAAPNVICTINGETEATIIEAGGAAQFALNLTNMETEDKIIDYVMMASTDVIVSASIINTDDEIKIPANNGSKNIFISLKINDQKKSNTYKNQTLNIYFQGSPDPVEVTFTLKKTTKTAAETTDPDPAPTTDPTNPNSTLEKALALDSTDVNGVTVAAPAGSSGDRVRIILPIINRNVNVWSVMSNRVTGITVTPVLSADQSKFPFVIEEVDYSRQLPDMSPGTKQQLIYDFKISDKATSGVKQVDFNAVYFNNAKDSYETATLSVFVNVIKGKGDDTAGGITDEDGNLITSIPKLIVESYSVKPLNTQEEGEEDTGNKLFAGSEFELTFTVRNTAEDEDIENIQITVENTDGNILPAEGGSNSLYIKKIGKGDSEERTIKLQSTPDIEAKSHTLSIKFGYESSKTQRSYDTTASLSLPINQRVRIKVDEPTIYETSVMLEQSVGIYFGIYNMGKSTIYNCMVDIEGEGLRMEETYYGGNITAGGTARPDFSIIPSTAGEIEGNVLIIYEDLYGEQTVMKKPFTLTVMEDSAPVLDDMGMMPDDPGMSIDGGGGGAGGGLPWWAFAIGGVVLAGVIVLVLKKVLKARRMKELEDV